MHSTRFQRFKKRIKDTWHIAIRGWTDDEVWSLDLTIAENVLPRLKRLKTLKDSIPAPLYNTNTLYIDNIIDQEEREQEKELVAKETWDEWNTILDKMIYSFNYVIDNYAVYDLESEEHKKYQEGMDLFVQYFLYLWY
jgi:hypothetical protein